MYSERKKWRTANEKQKDIPFVYDLSRLLDLSLWCLYMSKHIFGIDYLTYEEIENILENYFDIPVDSSNIKKALAPATGTKIIKNKNGFGVKISDSAERHLKALRKDGLLNVFCVDPNRPREAQQNLQQFVKFIPKGNLMICDPYYGINTLNVLEEFAKYHKKIQFLTREKGSRENPTALATAVSQFKKQYNSKVELRLTTARDFHDRYILASDRFLLIGHGLLDIGNKESLIVMIPDQVGKDIRKTLTVNFNIRWATATLM